MTIKEIARDLNQAFKEDKKEAHELKDKIDQLEKIIENLNERLEYLESDKCR